MKIVIAPDSFKESLTAVEACTAMAAGVRDILPDADIIEIPMAFLIEIFWKDRRISTT